MRTKSGAGRSARLLLLCIAAFFCPLGQCQDKIDISQCFSPVLVTHVTQNVIDHYYSYFLAVIDEDTYKKIQSDRSLMAILPPGMFSADWKSFQETREHYFELQNQTIDHYRSLATHVEYLPPEWQDTIKHCIDDVTRNPRAFGVSYFAEYSDPTTVRLEIKYRSTEDGATPPRVRSAQLDNAVVYDSRGQQLPLYRDCYVSWIDWTCPRIDEQNEFILKRKNPNEKIHVVLNLTNSTHSTGFDVDILPKEKVCKTNYVDSPEQVDKQHLEIHNYLVSDDYWGSDPNRLQLYFIQLKYPGKITTGSCDPKDSYNHKMNDDPNQRDRWVARNMKRNPDWDDSGYFRCLGMTNTGNTRFTDVEVHYVVAQAQTTCKEKDWAVSTAIK